VSSQKLDLDIRGLFLSPNNLSGVPPGALNVADNIVINSKNVADSRRGQTQYGDPLSIAPGEVNKLFNYASSLIVSYNEKLAYDSGDGAWVDYPGTYLDPAENYKMRSLEALRNFYFTTSEGVFKIDSITSTPRKAGVVKALGGTAATTGTSGFLLEDSAVAYRIVWGYRDANNNLLLGSPSQRLVVVNPAASGVDYNVNLTYTIPDSITTEYFYQIYRSFGTLTATAEPSDELQLVLQGNPTAAEITAKEFTVLDETPYSLMGAVLYTSPSQEGIANSNDEPPFALDMDIFKGSAFYANVRQKQRLTLNLISVDSPSLGFVAETGDTTNASPIVTNIGSTTNLRVGMRIIGAGIQADTRILSIDSPTQIGMTKNATATAAGVSLEFQDRFTIGEVDYWAGSTQAVATNTFEIDASGTPGQNIQATALNLIEVINKSALNTTLYAYYTSGVDDLPGQILFEERSIGGDTFFANSTAGSSFSPTLPEKQRISAISAAAAAVVTTSGNHGLTTGDIVQIFDTDSTPSIDGERIVTVLSPTTFSVPVTTTVVGTNVGYYIVNDDYVVSDNDARQNRVAISKSGQVEAVPGYTFFDIGSANFPIQRVVALRDGIFFFKNDGIYRLSGETFSNFTVTLLDNTVTLNVPESAVPFNNQVFCSTTQGICAVTDSGVQIMSVPIENVLLELSSEQYTNFMQASFGIAYESARLYMFFTVTQEVDTFATQAFVYNALTDSWTRWPMERTCGVVNTTVNKLFMAKADSGQILIERKSYTNNDYADEEYPVTILAVVSTTEVDLSSVTNVAVGMTLGQGARRALIEEINGTTLTITPVNGLTSGAALVYTPIQDILEWVPIDCENAGILKQFSEATFFFKNAAFSEIDASFSTNISVSPETVTLLNRTTNGWGRFPWGRRPWGSAFGGQNPLRTYVPREKQRGSWLTLRLTSNQAFTGFSLQGVSLIFNSMASRFR
jgi:hypothetical protein